MDTTHTATTASHRALGRATGAQLPDEFALGAARLIVTDLDRSIDFYQDVIGLVLLERGDSEAILGTPGTRERVGTDVLELELNPDARRASRHAGLYHVALLYPTREELARAVLRIAATRTMIDGASDHGTHEAIYLPDPDGNGLELAADRPREVWPNLGDIEEIRPRPLDLQALLALVEGEEPSTPAADGLVIGHVHLHVGDIARARAYYVDGIGFELVTGLDVAAFLSAGGYHHHLAVNTWKGEGVGPMPDDVVGLRRWTATVPSEQDLVELEQRLDAAAQRHERTAEGALVTWDPWGIELVISAVGA